MPKLALRPLILICAVLLAVTAAAEAKDLKAALIGKWQVEATITMEFKADGHVEIVASEKGAKPVAVVGTYKWTAADTVSMTLTLGDKTQTQAVKIAIDGDTLSMTDESKVPQKAKRVK